ncbi:hypothetical protein OG900_09640 [Streptomyces sp. NBC_00433]
MPLDAAVVIGDTFYAAPAAAAPLRLRIRFSPTIRQNVYSGLHLAVIHPDHGAIDSHHLAFSDHGTFTARDERLRAEGHINLKPGTVRDGTTDGPPWAEGDFTGLQEALAQYVRMWFNTSIPPLTPSPARRSRVRGVTALPTPAPDRTPRRPR